MQELIVAAIVLAATWVVARRYAPPTWKSAFSHMIIRISDFLGLEKLARKMETVRPEAPSCASGCATCGGCSPSPEKTPASEFVVMIDNLKNRTAGTLAGGKTHHQ